MLTTWSASLSEMNVGCRSIVLLVIKNTLLCLMASKTHLQSSKTWLMTCWETWSISLSLSIWMTFLFSLSHCLNISIKWELSYTSCSKPFPHQSRAVWIPQIHCLLSGVHLVSWEHPDGCSKGESSQWIASSQKKRWQLQRFLGFTTFYWRFIKNYSATAALLQEASVGPLLQIGLSPSLNNYLLQLQS